MAGSFRELLEISKEFPSLRLDAGVRRSLGGGATKPEDVP